MLSYYNTEADAANYYPGDIEYVKVLITLLGTVTQIPEDGCVVITHTDDPPLPDGCFLTTASTAQPGPAFECVTDTGGKTTTLKYFAADLAENDTIEIGLQYQLGSGNGNAVSAITPVAYEDSDCTRVIGLMNTAVTASLAAHASIVAPSVFTFPEQEVGQIPAVQSSRAEVRFSFRLGTGLSGDPSTDYLYLTFESAFGTPEGEDKLKCLIVEEIASNADEKIATTCEWDSTFNQIKVSPLEALTATRWYELSIDT